MVSEEFQRRDASARSAKQEIEECAAVPIPSLVAKRNQHEQTIRDEIRCSVDGGVQTVAVAAGPGTVTIANATATTTGTETVTIANATATGTETAKIANATATGTETATIASATATGTETDAATINTTGT